MKPNELCDRYKKRCIKNEGNISHLYLCPKGRATIGIGYLVTDIATAKALPFYTIKDSQEILATDEEKETEFKTIKKQKFGTEYAAGWYEDKTNLFLKADDINALYQKKTKEFIKQLCQVFPDFENYPDEACLALLDMIYNLGLVGLLKKFPEMVKAIRNSDTPDWVKAAEQCHRAPPISEERNKETQELFEQADLESKNKLLNTTSDFNSRQNFFKRTATNSPNSCHRDEVLFKALACEKALSFNPFTGGNN